MQLNRRKLLRQSAATAIAAPWLRPSRVRAAEFSLKYGTSQQDSYSVVQRMREAAKAILEETDGRIEISVFSNSQLGGDLQMLSQLRAGGLDFLNQSGLIMSSLVPMTAISGMGFVFPTYDAVWSAMDGGVGALIRTALASANIHAFEKIWDNGYRQTTSGERPIERPEDFIHLKIRVPPSPLSVSLFKAFGAAPSSLNIAELYTALQTRVVDGQENSIFTVEARKYYEVQKYLSITNHMWDGFWMLASGHTWRRLSDPLKEIVSKHFNAAAEKGRVDSRAQFDAMLPALQKHGMAVNIPDPAPFREQLRAAKFYEQWRKTYGEAAWDVLESYTGKLV